MKPASAIVLILCFLFTVGGWAVTLSSWSAATTPAAVGGLCLLIASNFAAALGVNISVFKKGE